MKDFDDLIDLAVIGPINTDIQSQELYDGEDLAIGSEVYLIGYPTEIEEFPQPTITRGILSRMREWEAIKMTYFQTDAAITGGQSGGALVSAEGDIIGISGFRFSDAGFGLVASAADLSPLADALVKGEDASVLGSRPIPSEGGAREHQMSFTNPLDFRRFIIDAPVGSTVELELDGQADGFLAVIDPFGFNVFFADSGLTGTESGSVAIDTLGQYFVVVGSLTASDEIFTLKGDADLIPDGDPDDGVVLSVGEVVSGNIDTLSDSDYFLLELDEGQTVEIRAESLNIDVFLGVAFPGSRIDQVVSDDDSGMGIFGTDSAITYRAIQSGVHYLAVSDVSGSNSGGYFISVTEAPLSANPVIIPPSYETVDSPYGSMAVFVNADSGFSIQFPSDWFPVEPVEGQSESDLAVSDTAGNLLMTISVVAEEPDVAGKALEEGADAFISVFKVQSGGELLDRANVQTAQGFDAIRLEWGIFDGLVRQNQLIVVYDSNQAVTIIAQSSGSDYEDLKGLFDHYFDSFKVE